MPESFLYRQVRERICRDIFTGVFKENESFPPERIMAEQLGVSRVTLRKALDSLEEDGIITRIQGSGNYIQFNNAGYKGDLGFVALISSTNQTFFNQFLDEFQKTAAENKTMVLFLQKPYGFSIEECIFKLYEKNVHDVVIWPEDVSLDDDIIRRLRGLGMNMVTFDTMLCTEYVDCAYLDNEHAIRTLYSYVQQQYGPKVLYIGWDNTDIFSIRQRRSAIQTIAKENATYLRIPWESRMQINDLMEEIFRRNMDLIPKVDAIMCENAELSVAAMRTLNSLHIDLPLVSVDDSVKAAQNSVTVYKQRIDLMARCVYDCLSQQNRDGISWRSKCFPIQGELIVRS